MMKNSNFILFLAPRRTPFETHFKSNSKCSLRKEAKRLHLEYTTTPTLIDLNLKDYSLLDPIDINDKNYISKPNFTYINQLENIRKEQKNILDQLKNRDHLNKVKETFEFGTNKKLKLSSENTKSFNGNLVTVGNNIFSRHLAFGKSKSQITTSTFEDTKKKLVDIPAKINDQLNDIVVNKKDKEFKDDLNYDLNYISNNLLSFSNQISSINNLYSK